MKGSQFESLEIGDRFALKYKGDQVMMKIPRIEIGGVPYNAVHDSNGILAYVQTTVQVFRFTGAMRIVGGVLEDVQWSAVQAAKQKSSRKQQPARSTQDSHKAEPSEPIESAQD